MAPPPLEDAGDEEDGASIKGALHPSPEECGDGLPGTFRGGEPQSGPMLDPGALPQILVGHQMVLEG